MPDAEVRDPLQKRQQVRAAKQAKGVGIPPIPKRPQPPAQTTRQKIAAQAATFAGHRLGPDTPMPNVAATVRAKRGPLLLAKERAQLAPGGIDRVDQSYRKGLQMQAQHMAWRTARKTRDERRNAGDVSGEMKTMDVGPTAPAHAGGPMDPASQSALAATERELVRRPRRVPRESFARRLARRRRAGR